MQSVCPQCNNFFETEIETKLYCSIPCAKRARKKRQREKLKEFRCSGCENLFTANTGSTVKKFCPKCKPEYRKYKPKQELVCPTCLKTFILKYKGQEYCTRECRPKKEAPAGQCPRCSKSFRSRGNKQYCSKKCSSGPQSTIYFFLGRETKKLKVGVTNYLDNRVSATRRGNFDEVDVLGTIPGDYNREQEIHAGLEPYRSHYEFYNYTPEVKLIVDGLISENQSALV